MWLEDADDPAGVELVERLGAVGTPVVTASRVLPFAAGVQHIIDEEFADGHRYYTKEAHVATLADEAIDKLVAFWQRMPMDGEVEIIGLGGAICDVAEADTAFSNRGYQMWLNLSPWTGKGIYSNMLNPDDGDRVVEAYGGAEKYARLGRLKARYDPDNLFRINANIVPDRGARARSTP
jgi:hypothetical protein